MLYYHKHCIVYYGYVALAFFAFDHLVRTFIIATTCPQHAVDAAVFYWVFFSKIYTNIFGYLQSDKKHKVKCYFGFKQVCYSSF